MAAVALELAVCERAPVLDKARTAARHANFDIVGFLLLDGLEME
jgi:hypothetical protein